MAHPHQEFSTPPPHPFGKKDPYTLGDILQQHFVVTRCSNKSLRLLENFCDNRPKRSFREFSVLFYPYHLLLAGLNYRNVIITARPLIKQIEFYFWYTVFIRLNASLDQTPQMEAKLPLYTPPSNKRRT